MENINYQNYFDGHENKYYDFKVIINIMEDLFEKSIDEIKYDISNKEITVSKDEINHFLDTKLAEENPDLKKRIESPKIKRTADITKWTEKDIEETAQEVTDQISIKRYQLDPYTLEYFKKYTSIVRNKAILLLNIIESIGNNNSQAIQNILKDLDILLDENGNILKSDIIRLITPTIYNIKLLNKKISDANNLETYLTFKISIDQIYKNGLSEGEVYPSKSIHNNSLYLDNIQGNVSLSEGQRKVLKKEASKRLNNFYKMINND